MNKKIRILYLIIVFSAIIGVGIVNAQEYTIEAALSSYGLEEPKVSILGNEVTIEYKQPVSEFGSMNEEFKKIAKILTIVADEHPTAYRVIIRQYFDDGQIMELVGKPEDGKAFLNNLISEETFSERLEFNPLTRGPPIIPGTCEPDKGENCENCVECVCYPNEFCDPTNPEADKKGCVVKDIPTNSQLVGSEYVCDEGYKWNSDLTGCVLENTVGGDSKYTIPRGDNYNHILVQPAVQKVLIGQNLQFDGFNTTPVTVSRIVSGDIANVYHADADNRIQNVNWQTSGAFYVNYDPMANTYDAQLSVEDADMPLSLKVGTWEVTSIAAGTNLIIDTRGMNLFPEDQVDLVVIGPDGQIKHDEVNNQRLTDITVDYLTSNYGDADNTLETAGWGIGAYIFWVKTDSEYACGLDAVSNRKELVIIKGAVSIEAVKTSAVELEVVKLIVSGVAGDPIKVEGDSKNVVFKSGVDDTPLVEYDKNGYPYFNTDIDTDGIRRYAVEFSNTGIYRIKVTVAAGDRKGDLDTVDITVLEKEVPLDLPAPIPSELEIAELFTSKSVYPKGEKVDVHYYITNTGTVDVDDYHVEYDIIDAKGKTVYENVGGAHSISAGDENKWHSEKWGIPSNAEYGPYTVKARLKWDSRSGTKTTDFFVTLATKTEDPRAELEIAELYTSKSAYLKGENVKVCYHIENVGTVDVYEYHVKYEIRGVDSEKICWFILSPHRIAVGEKQKWCPTGELAEWKIPSNAEYGTHTVEATLIWGSKTVEKKTAFLVKPH